MSISLQWIIIGLIVAILIILQWRRSSKRPKQCTDCPLCDSCQTPKRPTPSCCSPDRPSPTASQKPKN